MEAKSEALRLARELEACPTINYKAHAAELRRLHALNSDLLDALRRVMRYIPAASGGASLSDDMHRARKAIAAATKD